MVKVAKLACCARTAVGVARRLSEALVVPFIRVRVGVRVVGALVVPVVVAVAVAAVVVETAQVATIYLVHAVANFVADPTLQAAVAVARAVGYVADGTRVQVRVRVYAVMLVAV
tara:strand:+ start:275 stop:616 length:342 start_codon:yes stop_codon:yes gene_type:complete